ncbi:MAG: ammonia-forming cytochrome c nitrite reductase subunit c552 [Candidatus Thorarchaeota archaeon]|jgi:formate-dependent nitrite reductase cytochrome c552 subunit
MVHYTDSPTVNKRMVAGYYLFLVLLGFVILLGPTGGGIAISQIDNTERHDHELAYPSYGTDPTGCISCHEEEHDAWSVSEHGTSVTIVNSTHYRIGDTNVSIVQFNSTCSPCHTTGWDNSTGTPTYETLNINCFRCHNSTGYVDYAGDVCGECHRPIFGQPMQHEPWSKSAHANSLSDLRASDHAASYCMHCMSGEGFIHSRNPDMIGSQVDLDFDPNGNFNTISCPACHAVHSNWTTAGPHAIRAVNASQLCVLCHQGLYIWYDGGHNLAGVECVDCHGYDLANVTDPSSYFLNHTFVVNPDLACGQSDDCHEGYEDWALLQLEMIGDAFDSLTDEILAEATSFELQVQAYNQSANANVTFANEMQDVIDEVRDLVDDLIADDSHGFHNPSGITEILNEAYRDLLNAESAFYQHVPTMIVTETVTVTDTIVITRSEADSMLTLVGGTIGGLLLGIIFGVVIGKRAYD